MPENEVRHNTADHKFEVKLGSDVAVLEYRREGDQIAFTHTLVPGHHEGQGIGASLAKAGMEYARTEGLNVVPLCAYIVTYLRRNPQYIDLVAPSYRTRVERKKA